MSRQVSHPTERPVAVADDRTPLDPVRLGLWARIDGRKLKAGGMARLVNDASRRESIDGIMLSSPHLISSSASA